jgi:hypothetical protein
MLRRAWCVLIFLVVAVTPFGAATPASGLDCDGCNAFQDLIADIVTYAPPQYVRPFANTAQRAAAYFFGTDEVRRDPSKAETQLGVLRRQIESARPDVAFDKARLLGDVTSVVALLPRLRIDCIQQNFAPAIRFSGEQLLPTDGDVTVLFVNGKAFAASLGPQLIVLVTSVNGQLAIESEAGDVLPIKFPVEVSVFISPLSVAFVAKTAPCGQSFVLHAA